MSLSEQVSGVNRTQDSRIGSIERATKYKRFPSESQAFSLASDDFEKPIQHRSMKGISRLGRWKDREAERKRRFNARDVEINVSEWIHDTTPV